LIITVAMAIFIDEEKINQNNVQEEIVVENVSTVLYMLIDLLKKKPLQLLLGLLVCARGVMVLWFTVGEVYLTNDVKII
jgi:hypothetical protein